MNWYELHFDPRQWPTLAKVSAFSHFSAEKKGAISWCAFVIGPCRLCQAQPRNDSPEHANYCEVTACQTHCFTAPRESAKPFHAVFFLGNNGRESEVGFFFFSFFFFQNKICLARAKAGIELVQWIFLHSPLAANTVWSRCVCTWPLAGRAVWL